MGPVSQDWVGGVRWTRSGGRGLADEGVLCT